MQSLDEGLGEIERLPAADIPKQLRDSDPNLANQHLVRVDVQGYRLFIGDRSLTLACLMPYPGGGIFKAKAVEVFEKILELSFIEEVERCSIKYADFIEGEEFGQLTEYLDLDIRAGNKSMNELQGLNMQFSHADSDITNLVKIMIPANVRINNGPQKTGIILETDSIHVLNTQDIKEFSQNFPALLDNLHLSNKEHFFSLLTKSALEKLGATYAN